MTDSPFVQRMRQLDEERRQATSLSDRIRIDEAMADLIRANHLGIEIEPLIEPFDAKMAQTGESRED